MAIVTPASLQTSYDVIIVGSGAGGGQAAYTLTLEGVKVLMLEAGRNYDPTTAPMFQTPSQAPLRAAATGDKQGGFYDATVDGGMDIKDEPYTRASTEKDRMFWWWRARMLGGRTNHWTRVALRNGPYDFKPKSRDGLGFDWPVTYDEIAPYYDKVEMLVGVYGSNDGLENTPDSSPGVLLPPPPGLVSDRLIQQRAGRIGIPVVACRKAVLSRRLDSANLPAKLHPGNTFAQKIVREAMDQRAACFWATECERGCAIRANYQSTTVHLPPAMATGNLDILCNAMAREVTMGPDGRATGVTFVDKTTGGEGHAKAKVVVLAAGSAESIRLLLNSKSAQFPNGLANSSGLVGKYFTDTVGTVVTAQIPLLENLPAHNEDGSSSCHMYIPFWLYKEQIAGKLGFPRGYHIQFYGGRRMPYVGTANKMEWLTGGSYGRKFKEDARRYYGSFIAFQGLGETIPNDDTFCELDPTVKDKWGIPVMRFHWKWSDHERKQVVHMHQSITAIVNAMGGKIQGPLEMDPSKVLNAGGATAHEVGGAIMGDDPTKSVTNRWSQTHDVKNLFMTDGATFTSNSDKNPTLTIMALSWRAADRIVSEMRKGNL